MVHALKEGWRILVPEGTLIDLRPRSAIYPIEIVTDTDILNVGDFDGFGAESDDAAADSATSHLVEGRWFIRRRDTYFDVEYQFDSVSEMMSDVEKRRRVKSVVPSVTELPESYEELSSRASGKVRLRYCRPMMLTVYRKLTGS